MLRDLVALGLQMLCRFDWVLDDEVGLGCGGGLEVGRRGSQPGSGVQLLLL